MDLETTDLEAILAALAPRLLRYCLGQAGDRGLAEEAAQDALTAVVQRWRRLGPPDAVEAFAFTVARRRLARGYGRRRATVPLDVVATRPSGEPGPEARAAEQQTLRATLAALGRLRAPEREALMLVAAGELGGAEAASVLGIGTSALKMRVHRARQRLRALLETTP